MVLASGAKLGPYEVVSALGAGGMGEVYRAQDTRLGRTVAVKILPSHLSESPEAKQRFEREARAISLLNHPNICTLYDVGRQDGIDYLVMEFLEGETLADMLARGALSTEKVLKLGNEICEGLEKAHRSGVIHRDLKPGNIMLTKSAAKLMDFGLAKAMPSSAPPSSSLTATLGDLKGSRPLTAQGMLVGTFQYMSPEQVEGKEADARSDVFALGAVLYEMATGRRAFEGKTTASVIAAVLAAEPQPISAVQPASPPALDRVVKTCLAKDPDERFQSVHDVKLQLRWITEGGSQAGVPVPVAARRKNLERFVWSAAALALLAALVLSLFHFRQATAETRVVQSSILPPDNGTFVTVGTVGGPVLSPDGRNVAFVAQTAGVNQLWVRALDSFKPRALPGTEDAYGAFWSPDSKNLGFFAQGKLKRIAATGGPAVGVCDVDQARGASWNRQDVIIFGRYPGGIDSVPASGGVPTQVTHLDVSRGDRSHRWPHFLPDGNHFIYMATAFGSFSDENVFVLGSLDGKVNRTLLRASGPMAYDSGYLLYMVQRALMARPFDLNKMEFAGDAVPIAEGVQVDLIFSSAVFSASGNGVLLYQTGNVSSLRKLESVDHTGKALATLGDPAFSIGARISPEGKRLAYSLIDPSSGRADIWVQDIASGNRTRLTVDPRRSSVPVWSRDGERIAYHSNRSGKLVTYLIPSNGMGLEQKLWEPRFTALPNDWTVDSKAVIMETQEEEGKYRLVLVPAEGHVEPTPLLEVAGANVMNARLSPDGRWIAYQCDLSGKYEVYVSSFPKPAGRLQISQAGGFLPAWNRDGKHVYYLDPNGSLMAAELTEHNGSVQVAARRNLFPMKFGFLDSYDVFPDGKQFLLHRDVTPAISTPLSLVVNWQAELKK